MLDDVPEQHQAAAEEIRAHLVTLRGGAPFLSSRDALLLVGWLDEGVRVSAILLALERAADARRKRRIRAPLSLGDARRHLGKPTKGAAVAVVAVGDGPFSPIAAELLGALPGDPAAAALARALDDLRGDDSDQLVREALDAIRALHEARWDALTAADRRARVAAGLDALGDAAALLDEAEALAAAEEIARDTLRRELPMLFAATLWDLAEP